MKRFTKIFLTLLFVAISFISCNDNKDYTPPSAVETTFSKTFAGATNLYWLNYGIYQLALFNDSTGSYTNAYFNNNGLLMLTQSDIASSQVPSAVSSALSSSTYASWEILSETLLSRVNMDDLYVYSVTSGDETFMLYYTEDGTLDMQLVGGLAYNSASNIPYSIVASINASYPYGLIIDSRHLTSGNLEVEMLSVDVVKIVSFNGSLAWMYTYWQIPEDDVPTVVMNAVDSSEYSSYTISKVLAMELPQSVSYYQFTLTSSGNPSATLNVNALGQVVTQSME
ncbi:MAG: PepSY-like domain-containing protein [Rikenellaceae bacterium]